MEDGLDKKGDNKDFEEKLAEQLFADEGDGEKIQVSDSAKTFCRYCCQQQSQSHRAPACCTWLQPFDISSTVIHVFITLSIGTSQADCSVWGLMFGEDMCHVIR